MSEVDRETRLERLNATSRNTLMEVLGIRYTDVGDDYVVATMPVDARHHQPYGILHGGATAALAETVGSMASGLKLHGSGQTAVGLELAVNHLRPVRVGQVSARAEAVHLGRTTHLWQIDVTDEAGKRVARAKLTMMVRPAETA
ncbi:MAG: hotdog fold thioesterase [Wenzhouxiangellaceae bacterium]|nr:hotdog fold thioesterase [Wenzhouxiangellaceae bacterium]